MKKKNLKGIKIKKIFNNLLNYYYNNKSIIYMFLSFYILDISTRIFCGKIEFILFFAVVPNLFSFLWIGIITKLSHLLKERYAKILYIIAITISIVLFLVHNIYYGYFKMFFDFSVLQLASEGSVYMFDAIATTKLWVIIVLVISICLVAKTLKYFPTNKNSKVKEGLKYIVIFLLLHQLTPMLLGRATTELEWNAWSNRRNIYNSFNDSNKSMLLAGMYEYNIRNIYVNFFRKKDEISNDDKKLLEDKFNSEETNYKNNYTGIFKDKNLIIVQMEGIDDFLLTKDIMPKTYEIMNNSYNFTNHYSFVNGGGSTYNSEFMVNTGYTTPYTYNKNAYTFSRNDFKYSLANLFQNENYAVNVFHMNSYEYYSRGINYKNFGYDNYYGLKGSKYYKDDSYKKDTELINNPTFNQLIFNQKEVDTNDNSNELNANEEQEEKSLKEKFLSYVITYSTHMPFQSDKGVCKLLVDTQEYLSEFDCLKIQAKETDDMVGLLFDNLKEKSLLDNTVVVFFTDHYLYTLSDPSLLTNFKTTENNLINHTPFFIWSNDIKGKNITKVNSQLNILPTLLNMFGMEYHSNYYLEHDIFDDNFPGYVFFTDMSWYDGKSYVKGSEVLYGEEKNYEDIEKMNFLVNQSVRTNDAILKSDYFKNIK